MPIRKTRSRKTDGLGRYIVPLYQRPVLKFLTGQEYGPVAPLIFGTHPDLAKDSEPLRQLKALWVELHADILEAQARYQPGKKPWGMRLLKDSPEVQERPSATRRKACRVDPGATSCFRFD